MFETDFIKLSDYDLQLLKGHCKIRIPLYHKSCKEFLSFVQKINKFINELNLNPKPRFFLEKYDVFRNYLVIVCVKNSNLCTDLEMENRICNMKSTDSIKLFFEIDMLSEYTNYTDFTDFFYICQIRFIARKIVIETITLNKINFYFDIDFNFIDDSLIIDFNDLKSIIN